MRPGCRKGASDHQSNKALTVTSQLMGPLQGLPYTDKGVAGPRARAHLPHLGEVS